MKKKLLAMLALSAVLAMSAGLLAACNDPKDPDDPDTPCTEHVDKDNDGKCDNCGEDMGGEPVTPPEETKITDGVFSNQMDSSHEALIKLYEDGTAYLSGFTVSYKGWYEVKEEAVRTANTAADGTIIDPAAEADGKGTCEWLTFDTAIYFWADEAKTEPITVNASAAAEGDLPSAGVGYAYGTPANALAYDSESDCIYNYKFDQATRTLSHSSLRDFTTEDEAPIELYRFMLKNESDIPADAEEGAVISDFTLLITHKSFEGNLLGGSNVWNGKYVQEGNTYTLNDTFSGGEVGTLTIAEDGSSATFTNGTVTLELIPYEEVPSDEVSDLLTVETSINVGIDVPFTLTFKSDCTAVLSASLMGNSIEFTVDWELQAPQIVFGSASSGEFTYAIDADGAHVTWKGDLSDRMTDVTVPFTYWIHTADGTGVGGVYDSYDQNPGVLYLTKDPYTYTLASGSDGNYTQGEEVTNNVALRFQAATTGQEQNSWITALGSGEVDILELDYASETVLTMYESGKLMDITWWVEHYMPNYLKFVEDLGVGNLVTSTVDGEKKYLQLYTFQENVYEYYYGYQYRKDWLLEYGKVFSEDGTVGEQTFAEAHPDWGWQTDADGGRTWSDGVVFPSWYGLKYTSDGSATGTGTFTYDQALYDYMHGEYAAYSEQRAEALEEGAFSSLERDFDTYHGQWAATISDWEWLLDVMQAARAGLGYTQGYPMSMYQAGYILTGNLVSSFGGTGVEWQTDAASENVVFGADEPAFKTYVETMNKWYANGWIDPNFQTNDELFWRSDENTVRQGYVGLYLGMNDQLFGGMDMGTPTTEGIYVEGMPYPVNDKYGTSEQQYVKPYTFYCMQPEVNSIMITADAEKNGKDLAAMFTLLDACYTEEYGVMKGRGLSEEMLAESQDGVKEIYADVGYPDGTTVYNPDPDGGKGEYYLKEGPQLTTEQEYYTTCKRLFGFEAFVALREQIDEHQVREYLWNYFTPSEYLTKSFYGQLTPDQYDIYEDKLAELRNALAVDIPKFIKGDSSRPLSSWDSWYQSLKKTCQVDQITNMLNNVYHSLNG